MAALGTYAAARGQSRWEQGGRLPIELTMHPVFDARMRRARLNRTTWAGFGAMHAYRPGERPQIKVSLME